MCSGAFATASAIVPTCICRVGRALGANGHPSWVRSGTVTMNLGAGAGIQHHGRHDGHGDPASPTPQPGAFKRRRPLARIRTGICRPAPAGCRMPTPATAWACRARPARPTSTSATPGPPPTMVMNMINWFGDANGFVGNLALKTRSGLYRQLDCGLARRRARQFWSVQLTRTTPEVQTTLMP